jgi:hypothetical protein
MRVLELNPPGPPRGGHRHHIPIHRSDLATELFAKRRP